MGKNRKGKAAPPVAPAATVPSVRFQIAPRYRDTVAKYSNNQSVIEQLSNFIRHKRENPLASYGSKDYPFVGNGKLAGYMHAGLTQDVSVVYTLSGRDPHTITMYGIYSHAELGIGNTPRINVQDKMGKVFKKSTDFQPLGESARLSLLVELLDLHR